MGLWPSPTMLGLSPSSLDNPARALRPWARAQEELVHHATPGDSVPRHLNHCHLRTHVLTYLLTDCILFRFDLPDASSGLFRTQIMLGRGKKGQCHRIALDREGLRGTVRSPAPSCQWAARNRNIDISMRGFQVHNEGVSEGFPEVSGVSIQR